MCPPALAVPLAIASTVITAGAQIYGGMAANNQAKYEAQVAQQNRQMELNARVAAQEQNAIDQRSHWRRVAQAYGDQVARQSASGLDVNFGSPAALLGDVMTIGAEDSELINRNTVNQIRGYEINAANYDMQAKAARSRGKAALVSSVLNAGGTLLGGARQIGGMSAPRSSGLSGSVIGM